MLGGFAQGGVVVRDAGAPDIGDDRAFGLMDIAAAVLTLELAVEACIRRVAGNDERRGFVNRPDELQRQIGYTFARSCRTDNEALQVGIIALAGQAVTEIQVRHAAACRRQKRQEQDIALAVGLCELHDGTDDCRQVGVVDVCGDVKIVVFHCRSDEIFIHKQYIFKINKRNGHTHSSVLEEQFLGMPLYNIVRNMPSCVDNAPLPCIGYLNEWRQLDGIGGKENLHVIKSYKNLSHFCAK